MTNLLKCTKQLGWKGQINLLQAAYQICWKGQTNLSKQEIGEKDRYLTNEHSTQTLPLICPKLYGDFYVVQIDQRIRDQENYSLKNSTE